MQVVRARALRAPAQRAAARVRGLADGWTGGAGAGAAAGSAAGSGSGAGASTWATGGWGRHGRRGDWRRGCHGRPRRRGRRVRGEAAVLLGARDRELGDRRAPGDGLRVHPVGTGAGEVGAQRVVGLAVGVVVDVGERARVVALEVAQPPVEGRDVGRVRSRARPRAGPHHALAGVEQRRGGGPDLVGDLRLLGGQSVGAVRRVLPAAAAAVQAGDVVGAELDEHGAPGPGRGIVEARVRSVVPARDLPMQHHRPSGPRADLRASAVGGRALEVRDAPGDAVADDVEPAVAGVLVCSSTPPKGLNGVRGPFS